MANGDQFHAGRRSRLHEGTAAADADYADADGTLFALFLAMIRSCVLKRPGFGRCRGPVAVGVFVPRRAAHPRDNRPFGRGQVGVIVKEEAL